MKDETFDKVKWWISVIFYGAICLIGLILAIIKTWRDIWLWKIFLER